MRNRIFSQGLPILGALLLFALTGPASADTFMEPAGQIAADQKTHLIWVTAITMIAVIPVFVLLPIILLKYRRGENSDGYQPRWDFSLPLEIAMWGVPVLLICIMSVGLWKSTHKLDPYRAIDSEQEPLNIQVVGLDWKWLFIYPDLGIASVGEMAIPVNRPVAMTLTTDTVMQSFIISSLAGQIYAMPGMTTELHVMADKPGSFEGENMQYNGNGFVGQKFTTQAMDAEAFDNWVKQVLENGVTLNQVAYDKLAVQSSRAEAHAALATASMPADAIYFRLPDAHLFHKIVNRYHGGKPLPLDQQPGTPEFATMTKEASQ